MLDGREVRAYETGEGPLVLFLHGTGGNGRAWFNQLRRLGETHHCIAIDLPGYGQTPLGPLQAHDDYPAFLDRLMAVAGWDEAVMVGNSLGGRVALAMALDYPRRVAGLVLINSSGIHLEGVPTLSPFDMEPASFLKAIFYRPADRVMALRAAGETPPWLATARLLSENSLHEDLRSRLKEVAVPTLILWGEHDAVIPLPYAVALQEGIPGARLVQIPRAGHVPMLERPDAVNRAIAAFLEGP